MSPRKRKHCSTFKKLIVFKQTWNVAARPTKLIRAVLAMTEIQIAVQARAISISCNIKGTHRPKTQINCIDIMIDNPFWKVFFKKLNLGIIYLPRNVQKTTIKGQRSRIRISSSLYDREIYTAIADCACNKRNKDPVCTYYIRCKHTNDHIIPGFDCNQVHIDVQNRPKMRGKCLLGLVDLGSTMDKGID